jgi:CheY-like chemotaxis protein
MLLTADRSQAVAPRIEARVSGYSGQRRKIMVVDDDADHRMLMRDTLGPLGFTLFSASDGAQCMQLLPQCAPDLLLLDISLPGYSGWEVVRRIRALGFTNLPIIMVSANAFESQHLRDESSENCEFLVKPVVIPRLLDLLQKHLALQWTSAGGEAAPQRVAKTRATPAGLDIAHIDELIALGNIGYVRGIEAKLASVYRSTPEFGDVLNELDSYVKTFQFKRYLTTLEGMRQSDKQHS